MSATQSKADALREELAALRQRLAEAEARRVPEAVPLKPQVAAPVVGHSAAPFAPATRVQCATRVQSVVRGQQARQDPVRSLERARSISEGPAAAEERRRARERAREREARREEDYDAEAARQPEAAAEPSPAEQKKQQERVTPLMGTALLVALLELFALLENRHWAAATLDPKDHCECWYSCSKTPETKYEYDSDIWYSDCWYDSGSWDRDCACYFDVDLAYDLHGWTVNGRWKEWGEGETALPQEVKGGGCAPCKKGECGTAIAAAFDGQDCSHQVDALVGAAVCLAVAAAVFAALGWPKRFFPDVMLRRRFLASGLALIFGGVYVVSATGAFTSESGRQLSPAPGQYVACGRGCWDAYAGGVVAVVAGLAIVATQVSPGFCGKSGYPDCLLGVGLFAVVAFLLITTVKALWNGWLGLWGF